MGESVQEHVGCKRCGYCCRFMDFIFPASDEIKEWAKARGMKIVQANANHIEVRLFHPCPHLRNNNECKIQEHKPEVCRVYPFNLLEFKKLGFDVKAALGKECGFR